MIFTCRWVFYRWEVDRLLRVVFGLVIALDFVIVAGLRVLVALRWLDLLVVCCGVYLTTVARWCSFCYLGGTSTFVLF